MVRGVGSCRRTRCWGEGRLSSSLGGGIRWQVDWRGLTIPRSPVTWSSASEPKFLSHGKLGDPQCAPHRITQMRGMPSSAGSAPLAVPMEALWPQGSWEHRPLPLPSPPAGGGTRQGRAQGSVHKAPEKESQWLIHKKVGERYVLVGFHLLAGREDESIKW